MSQEILSLFISLLSAGITLFVYYKSRNNPLAKERLEKLYIPLFLTLEKELFNYVHSSTTNDERIKNAFSLMKNNLVYADSLLIEYFYLFMNEKDPVKKTEKFNMLSERIVTMCSRLSRKIGNGGFTPAFRFNQKLYCKKGVSLLFKIEFVLYFFVLPIISYFIIVGIFFIFIMNSPIFFDGILNLFK